MFNRSKTNKYSWTAKLFLCALLAFFLFELQYVGRILLFDFVNPSSSPYIRAEQERLMEEGKHSIRYQWVDYDQISPYLIRAVVAAEDADFMHHHGLRWDAIDFQNDGEFTGGCIAGGKLYCHINAAGDVEPCVFIHYSGANIREKSFLECLQQPLFKEYRKGQPFNNNHLRPCPMLENPELLGEMVKRSGAHSTDMQQPESPEDVFRRCRPYATSWMPTADRLWAEKHPGYVDPENPESANSCASCASCAACSAHQE